MQHQKYSTTTRHLEYSTILQNAQIRHITSAIPEKINESKLPNIFELLTYVMRKVVPTMIDIPEPRFVPHDI